MARVEGAKAVSDIWSRTLASYKKDLPPKDLSTLEEITSPKDVANHIENLEAKRHAGKRGAFAEKVHSITTRLTRFSSVIDIMTSSSIEASLVWGSLKLLLTIVHQSAEAYGKICQSILAVSDSFPTVESLAITFDHSELVCSHIAAFYASVLRFWSRALSFYRRRRLFNIFRVWHDFDSEFGDLDRDMKRHGTCIEQAAAAAHMNESRTAMLDQKVVNDQLIEYTRSAITSDRHRDIAQWLAPFNYETSYYADDLRSAYESCHPGTCMWILERPEFELWMHSDPNDATTRILWLTGVPGAGKTVLSSFVISRCSEASDKQPSTPTLYFFFKMTDSDKNSVIAVTRSLVYQLYLLSPANLYADILSLRDGGGKDKALSDQGLWELFVKHARTMNNLTIVLDALDECDGVGVLLRRLVDILNCCRVKIFVVSRREESIALVLEVYPHIVITHGDIEADINSYAKAEIAKVPRFRGKPIEKEMVSALSSGHGGMFLWAYLMIQELKELGTGPQVRKALNNLPRGLDDMHENIITRLDATLHPAHRQLAIKILKWIVCAVRPLRLVELQEIMRFDFREGRSSTRQSADDDDFLYSEKDIELACGALVLTRNGTLQLIHLSTKEILLRKPPQMLPEDPRLDFYVDAPRENPYMAVLCVAYISSHLDGIKSLPRPNSSRLRFTKRTADFTHLVKESPFIDYASMSWQVHLIDGQIDLELESVVCRCQDLLTYDWTISWIELCASLHQDIIWTMERSCKETISWADYGFVPAESSCHKAIAFLWAWSNGVLSIINEYGHVIKDYPYEIHYLDLENTLRYKYTPGSPVLPSSYAATQAQDLRERIAEVRTNFEHSTSVKVDSRRQLQRNAEGPASKVPLGFLVYDSKRQIYITAESTVRNNTEVLWVQERATGRRLKPVRGPLPNLLEIHLINAVLSRDCTYLAILYSDYRDSRGISAENFITSIWVIEDNLDFHDLRSRRPWARRLHCFRTRETWFMDSCLPLTAGRDGLFYCPSGQIHPEYGIQKQLPLATINDICTPDEPAIFAFAGDGQTLVRLDRVKGLVENISLLEDTVTKTWQLPMPASHAQQERVYFRAISRTARFMVYQFENELNDELSDTFYLFHYQGNPEQLRVQNTRFSGWTMFYFTQDEQYLLGIHSTNQGKEYPTYFSRWAMNKPSFIPQEETIIFVPDFFPDEGSVCVVEEDSIIILVTNYRVVYELDLQSLKLGDGIFATTEGISSPYQPYCVSEYRISRNGSRIVGLYMRCPEWSKIITRGHMEEHSAALDIGKTHLELEMFDLSGTADQVQTLELEYADPQSMTFHVHVITFSPDLSIVQAGAHIFDLSAPGHPRLSFPDNPLDIPRHGEISFSSCNRYLVIIKNKDDPATNGPATYGIFRIYGTVGKIEKVAIPGLDYLVADVFWAAFHPELPLLVLTCLTRPEPGVRNAANNINAIEIDLEALKPTPIGIPKHDPTLHRIEDTMYWEYLSAAEVQFSDCGSFCFLTYEPGRILILKSNALKENAAKMQTPAVWGGSTSYNQGFFRVDWREESTMVILYQALDQVDRFGFRHSANKFHPSGNTIEVAITAIPAHLAPGVVYLLVGKSGDDLTRMLLLPKKGPPEIKDLRVTLNQILDELATRPLPATTEEYASDTGSEIVPVSADEEGLGINEEESNHKVSQKAAMSADDDRLGFSHSEESRDTRSEVAGMSADDERPGVSDSD
ncbi:hypothetical protein JMJ35_010680 [Cladonia borealis]|uniref:NACHT domain-containing protein n=1 Tax=Cladonia borealis TaxID=184061 RepID=A0AA39QPY8_9LECA|nr:hypothetical protein JMJ35_010680 [Cladonia borealis]